MNKYNIKADNSNVNVGDHMNVEINSVRKNADSPQQPATVHRDIPSNSAQTQETQSDSVNYKIKQGYALIIHNSYFPKRGDPGRAGSEKDEDAIRKFCKNAGFFVCDTDRSTKNITAEQIRNHCHEIAQHDFNDYDAFACFILSHGDQDGIYGTDDKKISVQDIVSMFKKAQTLVAKPKLFFIQACRGKNKDDGILADEGDVAQRGDPFRLPSESDILIAHSTSEGYESYRNREVGSWFFITLMEMLRNHAHDKHLMDILTLVNQEISKYETKDGKKQMPCQASTLTKFVYFNHPAPLSS